MAFEFKLPDIGEGVVEGEIVKWLVKPGDTIAVDQPMVEVMTDKATVVIPSPKAGVVLETRGKEGDIAKVHAVLVVIDDQAGGAQAAQSPRAAEAPRPAAASPKAAPATVAASKAPPPPPAKSAPSAPPKSPPPPPPRSEARAAAPVPPPPAPRSGAPSANGAGLHAATLQDQRSLKVLAAPATRRLARELGVELTAVPGTGPAGRITSEDVRRIARGDVALHGEAGHALDHDEAHEAPRPAPAGLQARPAAGVRLPGDAEGDEHLPVRGLRKRIWDNMSLSKSMLAHFTFVEECDATELVKIRERFNGKVKSGEEKLTFLPFIVKAVIATLKRFPDLNAHVDDDKQELIRRHEYHIGIAVASDRGLIVPVVRHADRRSIIDLAREIKRLSDAVRSNQLRPEDLGGSTFTITSLGKDGGIFATPIINYPEVAIMGVHKISKKPAVVEEQIVIRDMMNLSLSFDHRLIDGHVGAAFTYGVIGLLEQPDRLMMEML